MKLHLITVLVFVLVFAQRVFPAEDENAVDHIFSLIYNEQYDEAEQALLKPNESLGPFYTDILKIDLCWWEFVQTDKSGKGKELQALIDKFIQVDENSKEAKIRQLIGKSYQIRYELKRYNIIGAALVRSDIKNLLEEIKKQKLSYTQNRLDLLNLYDTLFQYFDSLINPFFSENKRIVRANALATLGNFMNNSDLIVQTLACYFTGKIYLNIEKEPEKGRRCFEMLSEKFPQNAYFSELLIECKNKI